MREVLMALASIGIFLGGIAFFMSRAGRRRRAASVAAPRLTDWDVRCLAYHEAGHAVCSRHLPEREKLIRITIDPGDEAFGMIRTAPRPHHNETEESLTSAIGTFLAGRISEERFLKAKTTSCIYDLDEARNIAVEMATKYGMGKRLKRLAPVSIHDGDYRLRSEEFRRMADEDVMDILETAGSMAEAVIERHSAEVVRLAETLLVKNTLSGNDIDLFFGEGEI